MSDAHDPPQANPAPDDNRRQFFQVVIGGMTCMSVGTVGYPIVSFLKLPESMTQDADRESLAELDHQRALQEMQAAGVEVVTPDLEAFRAAVSPIYTEMFRPGLYDEVRREIDRAKLD